MCVFVLSQVIGDSNASLLTGAVKLARSVAAKSPVALVGTKRALLHQRWVCVSAADLSLLLFAHTYGCT